MSDAARFGNAFVLATHRSAPDPTTDDHLLASELKRRGCRVSARPWDVLDGTGVDGQVVVVRSTWDYHHRPDEFRAWTRRVEARGGRLVNDGALIRWNMHKAYLLELVEAGLVLPKTWLVNRGDEPGARRALAEVRAVPLVIKPAVSASANRTVLVSDPAEADAVLERFLLDHDMIVQEFIPAIRAGEWSLIFFGDTFSHAVRKVPAAGGFLVQEKAGGTFTAARPPAHVVGGARRALEAVPGRPVFARVDGVDVDGTFVLMELELIEPDLFIRTEPSSVSRFADALDGAARDT